MLNKKTIIIGEFELHYWLSRNDKAKNTLVMLHGVASNHTRWSEFTENTALRHEWNLLSLDLRGHGGSMYRGIISRSIWVKDLKTIIEFEQLSPVVLLGHSLGTEVALDFITAWPEKCQSLIMIDPVFPRNLHGILGWVKRFKYLIRLMTRLIQIVNFVGVRRRHFDYRDMQQLDKKTRKTLLDNPQMEISELYTNPFADLPYIPVANYLQDQFEVVRPLPVLEPITLPALVLLSTGASLSDRDADKDQIKRLPNSKIVEIDCDHWPLTEQPELVQELIDEWCFSK